MTVLQLSDPHAESPGRLAYGVADTSAMLHAAVRHIKGLRQKPDLVVVSGDIACNGCSAGYTAAADALGQLDMPVYVMPGNHDDRALLMRHLGHLCPAEPCTAPALCYATDAGEMSVICLDTSSPGRHGGQVSRKEAAWLEEQLGQAPRKPVLLFMHHPPLSTGMKYMDEPFEGIELLADVLRVFPDVHICCGHMHRAFAAQWVGRTVACCPSCSVQMEIVPGEDRPPHFFMEAPGYALHTLQDGAVITFFGQITSQPTFSGPHPFRSSVTKDGSL